MPEFLVTSISPKGTWCALLLVLLCAALPSFNLTVQGNSNCSSIRNTYDPNSRIDARLACEFVSYWANMAFDYETTDTFANQQAASKWTSAASLNNQLDKTFWTKDFHTRPTSCQLVSVSHPVILDDKTAGVTVETVFSWANIGLKKFPMNLYVVVKKQSEGYRIDTIQFNLDKKLVRSPFVLLDGQTYDMFYWNGKNYVVADNYREAIEKMRPNLSDKHSFDSVFFSWYQKLSLSPQTTGGTL